ncbi:MAG: gliding motility lipoprotein GldH [Candidatus Azobacteroides sp.]|nr:gliding motility lipoprotein GldH [Candidatus Azobacteroides sp.]
MNKFLLFIMCCFLLSACTNKNTYTCFRSFKNAEWDKDSIPHFEINISDTINPHQIFVETRNNNLYPYQNIWLFIEIKTPSGNIRKDTLSFDLADNFGKWYGKGINIHRLVVPYEKSIIFRQQGNYTFSIRHGMRDDVLKGISEVGIKLTK